MSAAETLGGKPIATAGGRAVRNGKWIGGLFRRNPIKGKSNEAQTSGNQSSSELTQTRSTIDLQGLPSTSA